MKTPTQELLEHFINAWSSPSDLWKPSKVIEKIESMVEKERNVIKEAFYAGGQAYSYNTKWEKEADKYYDNLTK